MQAAPQEQPRPQHDPSLTQVQREFQTQLQQMQNDMQQQQDQYQE